MAITREKGGKVGEVEESKGEINGDGRRLDLGVNTEHNIQMSYYRIVHLKPISFYKPLKFS